MKKEVNPKDTTRARAFELWMKAPNPMVTFFKTIDVTRLVNVSKRKGMKFNMLLDYCIGRAASSIKEFYLLPVGERLLPTLWRGPILETITDFAHKHQANLTIMENGEHLALT